MIYVRLTMNRYEHIVIYNNVKRHLELTRHDLRDAANSAFQLIDLVGKLDLLDCQYCIISASPDPVAWFYGKDLCISMNIVLLKYMEAHLDTWNKI